MDSIRRLSFASLGSIQDSGPEWRCSPRPSDSRGSPRELKPGLSVRVKGTDDQSDGNGKEGVLLAKNEDEGTWIVRLNGSSDHSEIEVEPQQLQVLSVPASPSRSRMSTTFITVSSESGQNRSPRRKAVARMLYSSATDACLTVVILFNFALICLDTDSRATYPGHDNPGEPPRWVTLGMHACFVVFAIELAVRLYVEQREFPKELWNCTDAFIVLAGFAEFGLLAADLETAGFGVMRAVRLCRLLRLMRAFRLVATLKELRRLVQMMGSCFKTLFWSFMLLLLVMTIWASIAVELVNPLIQRLAEAGAWSDCERCRRAYSSVFMANITFFQTVVAGDSWGLVAIPVIEEYPWAALVFAGSLMTLVFGVLNLIVAVIVDTFAETRSKNVIEMARELDYEEIKEKQTLSKIFERIDVDRSGALSFDELKLGARRIADLRHWLRVLDIDAADLEEFFHMVDQDGSGEIDPEEFVEAMYRMKHTESRTAARFVKHLVTGIARKQDQMEKVVEQRFSHLERRTDAVVGDGVESNRVSSEPSRASGSSLQESLADQDSAVQEAIRAALARALEVALEAARDAAEDVVDTISAARLRPDPQGIHAASCHPAPCGKAGEEGEGEQKTKRVALDLKADTAARLRPDPQGIHTASCHPVPCGNAGEEGEGEQKTKRVTLDLKADTSARLQPDPQGIHATSCHPVPCGKAGEEGEREQKTKRVTLDLKADAILFGAHTIQADAMEPMASI